MTSEPFFSARDSAFVAGRAGETRGIKREIKNGGMDKDFILEWVDRFILRIGSY